MTPSMNDFAYQNPQTNALEHLKQIMPESTVHELEHCAERLEKILFSRGPLRKSTVLAMFGGGKDSSYMLYAARFMQLVLQERYGETFQLRIATNRHAGMPEAVIANIDHAYTALELYHCPNVELLIVNGHSIARFTPDAGYPEGLRNRDRLDVLMTGHRCQGDSRPSYCNRCNISMENALAMAVAYGAHADVVLTGDSPIEQKHYLAWVRRAARKLNGTVAGDTPGLHSFLVNLEHINQNFSSEVFGEDQSEVDARRIAVDAVCREPQFFSIYQDTPYRLSDHWGIIVDFLGFVFDDIAFSFTESDCGNPGLMAHSNGLRHERILGSTYSAGIREYEEFALDLMRRKDFPEHLIQVMKDRYASETDVARMRRMMDEYARAAFALTEEQLVCMLMSPFTEGARNLHAYLQAEQPHLLLHEQKILAILRDDPEASSDDFLAGLLTSISGLKIDHLRRLFAVSLIPTRQPVKSAKDPFSIILAGDPHKKWIDRTSDDGSNIHELISGR